MWAAMPIFVHGRAISVKSLVWKFGSDWLSFSRVIVYTDKKKKKIIIIEFPGVGGGGRNSLLEGDTFDLWCPFSDSDELFQSKVMCENLVWIGWNRRYVKFQGGKSPYYGGGEGHMWAAMPIFVHGRAIPVKTLVWKFGSDWLSLSRVIPCTDKKKK